MFSWNRVDDICAKPHGRLSVHSLFLAFFREFAEVVQTATVTAKTNEPAILSTIARSYLHFVLLGDSTLHGRCLIAVCVSSWHSGTNFVYLFLLTIYLFALCNLSHVPAFRQSYNFMSDKSSSFSLWVTRANYSGKWKNFVSFILRIWTWHTLSQLE